MLSLYGAGIGRGIAIGQAYVLKNSKIDIQRSSLKSSAITKEISRFKKAINETEQQYRIMQRELPSNAPKEAAAFINAHRMMLKDPLLVNESIKIIRRDKVNAEYAVDQQAASLIKVFEDIQDPYLRNKKADVRHVTNRLLRSLLGIVSHTLEELDGASLKGRIIVGKDINPAEAMFIKEHKASAFITDLGSQISHTSIVARSLKLPAVVGLHGNSRYIREDELLIVDGMRGTIILNPSDSVLREYRALQRSIRLREKRLETLKRKKTKSTDGERVRLMANIENTFELKEVKRVNAEGIGLYRTEYLFMNRDSIPTEEEQFKAYKRITTSLDKPVVIRTLDIGGDKRLTFSYPQKTSSESPLGLRGVRLCLNNVELFKPQLRAILRASAFGKISIMIPMVSNFDEITQTLALITQTKKELKQKKIAYDSRIRIGGMIEVPAAAISAELFAEKLDFLSIGTNDLIQYTLAIDRVDDAVNYLYDPLHPAVLNLITHVINVGQRTDTPVSLCGEMAGNVQYTRLLLGLGLKNFSMDATYLLDVKERILTTNIQTLSKQVNRILNSNNPSEARDHLTLLNQM